MSPTIVNSLVGPLRLEATEQGLIRLAFRAGSRGPSARAFSGSKAVRILDEAQRQLTEYFSGRRREFDLPLAPAGTEFQRAVWTALRAIPYGETISYGELARRLGRPRAARAVGTANGRNPIPIVIPCHRVVGADGSLVGYGGGLDIKRRLLELEGVRVRQARLL